MTRIKLKNGVEYILRKIDHKYYLITYQKEKADSTFEWLRNGYRKEIDPYDDCVEECFDVYGYFLYDAGIPDLSNCYVLMGDQDLENNVVYIYDGHNREGWEDMGRNLSRKKVDLRKASAQYIQKSIFIKNGRKCDPPIKEKIFMSRDEFVKTYIGYYGQNM